MRLSCLAIALITAVAALTGTARAFETEGRKVYGPETSAQMLRIISTADEAAFDPIIRGFQTVFPDVTVDYTIASSAEVMKAIYEEDAPFDLVISSAMDLQTKLANDGFAQPYASAQTDGLPSWAKWRDQVFAFTQEPAVLVVSEKLFGKTPIPENREELIGLLRDQPERFRGRVGTYDVRTSGLGYLFATQDSRNSESFWRLTEVMGSLDARLYCCSSDMISDVADGKLAVAYNVLGSYAESRLPQTTGVRIVELNDFLSVMLRTALIPTKAQNLGPARAMVDYLVTLNTRPAEALKSGLPPIDEAKLAANNAMRPIRLGPGLLVFLDRLKRETFLRSWSNAILQQ